MANNDDPQENTFAVLSAAISSLLCLLILFLVTRPMARVLSTPWDEWLLAPLLTLVPMGFTLILLYHSAWHLEWSGLKRILLCLLASCIIWGINLVLLCLIAAFGAFNVSFISK